MKDRGKRSERKIRCPISSENFMLKPISPTVDRKKWRKRIHVANPYWPIIA